MLKRDGGFSLVELMAVCAIIGIIMAIAIPYYVSYKRATCDRVAQEDLVNIAAAWEKYINDESNLKHKAPQDLKDLAGEFYGWGGTSTKCDVRFYLEHSTLTVYSASYKGSHPRGPGSRYMYMMKMPAGLTPSSARLDRSPGLFWSILGSIGSLLEPAPAYAKSNNKQSNKGGSSGSEDSNNSSSNSSNTNTNNQSGNQNQNQNQNANQGNSDSNHQDRNTDGNQQGQGNANGNAWGQGNGNNGNNSGNSGSGGQSDSGSTGGSSSDSTPSDTGASGGSGSDSGTSSAGGTDTGASSGGGGSSTAGGSDSGTAGSAGGTSGGTTDSAAVTEGAALTGSKPVGLVSTTDLDSAWKAYPFGVGPSSSAFDSSGTYIQR